MCGGAAQKGLRGGAGASAYGDAKVQRPGNDGICHSGGSLGGDCDSGNHAVQTENSGAVGCHRFGHQRSIGAQGTVEYAVVAAAFVAAVVALGALWRMAQRGSFVEHALAAAAHCLDCGTLGSVADLLLY